MIDIHLVMELVKEKEELKELKELKAEGSTTEVRD